MNISRAKCYNILMYRLLSNLPVKGKCKEILHFCKVVKYSKTPFQTSRMGFSCDSDRIQTCNLLIRSQMLYSVELRSRLQSDCYVS